MQSVSIRLAKKTRDILKKLKVNRETYDDVLKKLIKKFKENDRTKTRTKTRRKT